MTITANLSPLERNKTTFLLQFKTMSIFMRKVIIKKSSKFYLNMQTNIKIPCFNDSDLKFFLIILRSL